MRQYQREKRCLVTVCPSSTGAHRALPGRSPAKGPDEVAP